MRINGFNATVALLTAATLLSACATGTQATVRGGGPTMGEAVALPYNGPKARLAVAKFIDKTSKAGPVLGTGMSDMLVTALFRTNRYILLDREDLNDVVNEQDFAASGRISEKTATKIGELEGAELLVFGAITAFEPDHLGVGGLFVGALTLGASIAIAAKNKDAPIGALTYKDSYIAMDIKIVDAATGRVVAVTTVEGAAEQWGGGIVGAVGGGWSRTPVALGGFVGTSVEQAVEACLEAAVMDIVKNTPSEYYRVKETLDFTPAGLMARIYPVSLAGATPSGIKEREGRVINSQEKYERLLSDFGLTEAASPKFDWEKISLIAVFSGEKPVKGYMIGVEKAIHKKDALEVYIREVSPPEGIETVEEPDFPYDIVKIDNPGKPVRFVWE
ncbi:hypothetical protein MNBD_NITROSPINAE04-1054 [hydrothermal vent metagenome]|uniref:PrcB C-terminal domain-containing protein n=1 Tax=hydrothermal vent metagenome TaxID=652676 RepID=A0A3B1C1E4_9ZZZZ